MTESLIPIEVCLTEDADGKVLFFGTASRIRVGNQILRRVGSAVTGNPWHDSKGRFTSRVHAVPHRITNRWLDENLPNLTDDQLADVAGRLFDRHSRNRLAKVKAEAERRSGFADAPKTGRKAKNKIVIAGHVPFEIDPKAYERLFDSPVAESLGITTRVSMQEDAGSGFSVSAVMRGPQSDLVGEVRYHFYPMPSHRSHVEVTDVEIAGNYQNKKLARDWLGNLAAVADGMGIKQLTLTANIDVGGYAWARYGFDYTNNNERLNVIKQAKKHLHDDEMYFTALMSDAEHGYLGPKAQDWAFKNVGKIDKLMKIHAAIHEEVVAMQDEVSRTKHSWDLASWEHEFDLPDEVREFATILQSVTRVSGPSAWHTRSKLEQFQSRNVFGRLTATGREVMLGQDWYGQLDLDPTSTSRQIFDTYVNDDSWMKKKVALLAATHVAKKAVKKALRYPKGSVVDGKSVGGRYMHEGDPYSLRADSSTAIPFRELPDFKTHDEISRISNRESAAFSVFGEVGNFNTSLLLRADDPTILDRITNAKNRRIVTSNDDSFNNRNIMKEDISRRIAARLMNDQRFLEAAKFFIENNISPLLPGGTRGLMANDLTPHLYAEIQDEMRRDGYDLQDEHEENTRILNKLKEPEAFAEVVVSAINQNWSATAMDRNLLSWAIQRAGQKEFGVENAHWDTPESFVGGMWMIGDPLTEESTGTSRPYGQLLFPALNMAGWADPNAVIADMDTKEGTRLRRARGALFQSVLRQEYNETQETLEAMGIDELVLQRGMGSSHAVQEGPPRPEVGPIATSEITLDELKQADVWGQEGRFSIWDRETVTPSGSVTGVPLLSEVSLPPIPSQEVLEEYPDYWTLDRYAHAMPPAEVRSGFYWPWGEDLNQAMPVLVWNVETSRYEPTQHFYGVAWDRLLDRMPKFRGPQYRPRAEDEDIFIPIEVVNDEDFQVWAEEMAIDEFTERPTLVTQGGYSYIIAGDPDDLFGEDGLKYILLFGGVQGTESDDYDEVRSKSFAAVGLKTNMIYDESRSGEGREVSGLDLLQRMAPLSSWATTSESARTFGSTITTVRVPRERVHSTAMTGIGCLTEFEVILLGGDIRGSIHITWRGSVPAKPVPIGKVKHPA